MALYTDRGIIFKIKDFGEADRLVSVLGMKKGRIDAIAKGARKPESRKTASIDLINLGKFSFAEGKNLDILTEVDLLNPFEKLKGDLRLSNLCFLIAELTDVFFPDVSQGSEIYGDLKKVLGLLDKKNAGKLILIFELKLLNISGFGPNVETCNLCGNKIKEGIDRVAHSGSEIGFICARHIKTKNKAPISDRLVKAIKFFLKSSYEEGLSINLESEDIKKLGKLHRLWIQSIIGREIKSYNLLEKQNVE